MKQKTGKRSALLAGATGLTGGHVLDHLLHSEVYDHVITIGRSEPDIKNEKLTPVIAPFTGLAETFKNHHFDDIYCCLGTTMKKAGSRPAFFRVDYEYVRNLAEFGIDAGAQHFALVSSTGASADSSNFYLRVKGQIENALKPLNYRGMHIFRPALLLGERSEVRAGERIAEVLMRAASPLLFGPLSRYRPIEARKVASAMVSVVTSDIPGVYTYESDEIEAIGSRR
jgi:uncharacterized protein YbjT (DUF2867 family)